MQDRAILINSRIRIPNFTSDRTEYYNLSQMFWNGLLDSTVLTSQNVLLGKSVNAAEDLEETFSRSNYHTGQYFEQIMRIKSFNSTPWKRIFQGNTQFSSQILNVLFFTEIPSEIQHEKCLRNTCVLKKSPIRHSSHIKNLNLFEEPIFQLYYATFYLVFGVIYWRIFSRNRR